MLTSSRHSHPISYYNNTSSLDAHHYEMIRLSSLWLFRSSITIWTNINSWTYTDVHYFLIPFIGYIFRFFSSLVLCLIQDSFCKLLTHNHSNNLTIWCYLHHNSSHSNILRFEKKQLINFYFPQPGYWLWLLTSHSTQEVGIMIAC